MVYDNAMLMTKKSKMHCLLLLLLLLTFTCLQAHANTWQVCKLTVNINHINQAEQKIEATVINVAHKPQVECPAQGETITFTPESADYQSTLAKKHWPKVGRLVKMRYQYLDGECKDRGPCRIKHYPLKP